MGTRQLNDSAVYFRACLATLGWTIVGSGARLGISRRHAQRLAVGSVHLTETIRRLLAAHLELKELYEQRGKAWATQGWREPTAEEILILDSDIHRTMKQRERDINDRWGFNPRRREGNT